MRFGFCRASKNGGGQQRITDKTTGVTTLVACDPHWGRWLPGMVPAEPGCGCVNCVQKLTCNRDLCDPKQISDARFPCHVPCTETPVPPCTENIVLFHNRTAAGLLYINLEGFVGGWLLGPGEQATYNDPQVTGLPIAAGQVGTLNLVSAILRRDKNEAMGVRMRHNIGFKCGSYIFEDVPRDSCVPSKAARAPQTELELLKPVQVELDRFMNTLTRTQTLGFLNQAKVYFLDNSVRTQEPKTKTSTSSAPAASSSPSSPSATSPSAPAASSASSSASSPSSATSSSSPLSGSYYFVVSKNSNGSVFFQSQELLSPPEPFTIVHLQDDYFQLLEPNTTNVAMGPSTHMGTRFRLALSRPSSTEGSGLQRNVSIYPFTADGGMCTFGYLPFTTDASAGLDDRTMVIVELSNGSRDLFLENSPASAVQCCVGGTYAAYAKAVCRGSSYDSGAAEGQTSSMNCDNVVKAWCEAPSDGSDLDKARWQVCGCYDTVPIQNAIQRQILEYLRSKDLPFARKCIVGECLDGHAYKDTNMRNAPCPGLCVQIQQAINIAEFGTIDFHGIQSMVCGDTGVVSLPPGTTLGPSALTLAIILYVLAAVVLVVGLLLLRLLVKEKPAYLSIPVLAAIVLLVFAALVQTHVI